MKKVVKSPDTLKLIPDMRYKVIYSRRRTMSIIVSPDKGVIVKAPLRTPARLIKRFVEEKSEWIIRTLNGFRSLINLSNINFSNGGRLLFEGHDHQLRIIDSEKYYIKLVDGNEIEVGTAERKDPAIVQAMLEAWFKIIATRKLTLKFREIVSKYKPYDLSPSNFSVSKMKKRWGSCSSSGRIAVSYDLIRLDPVFTDYVIIHELCHLRHHNHSAEFYRFLHELYPDWKRVREDLGRYIR